MILTPDFKWLILHFYWPWFYYPMQPCLAYARIVSTGEIFVCLSDEMAYRRKRFVAADLDQNIDSLAWQTSKSGFAALWRCLSVEKNDF